MAEIERLWKERTVLWLAGVRRSGKTTLCQSLPDVEHFDCELPRVRRALVEPESFFEEHRGRRVVLDEIHRLDDPAEFLKIAADHYPEVQVLATGSSTLSASRRFRDTLTGRKRTLWLSPMTHADGSDFNRSDVRHRMLHGGLPPMFLAKRFPEADFRDWVDGYWAKDLQVLFRLERRDSMEKLLELIFAQSGGLFTASSLAAPCGVSHTTIQTYLRALEETFVVHVVRPFHSSSSQEIVKAPKVYGFDTGFVCYFRGWDSLRRDDHGILWEHLVLNEIFGTLQTRAVRYWRDKSRREVDFVLPVRRGRAVAVEAKWSADAFDASSMRVFRERYPEGGNLVVAQDVGASYTRASGGLRIRFVNLAELPTALRAMMRSAR